MASRHKSGDADSLDVPNRRHTVLPLSEKVCVYGKKYGTYTVWYNLRFQASIGGLGTYSLRISGDSTVFGNSAV